MSMRHLVCGLDFGTSNTAATLWDAKKRERVRDFLCVEPTLMHFPCSDSKLEAQIGEKAITSYLSSGMTGRFFQAIKTTLPQPSFTHTRVNGVKMEIEELCAIIIRHFKKRAEEATGIAINTAVIGRPAVFHTDPERDTLAQKRLTEAAHRAGFDRIAFQYEPIAAALEYESTLATAQTVLVGDFGGGTSDFTIMRLSPQKIGQIDRKSDILATAGIPIAGNRMDSCVMYDHILPLMGSRATYANASGGRLPSKIYAHTEVCQWDKIHHLKQDQKILERIEYMIARSDDPEGFLRLRALIDHNYGFALFKKIEGSKIDLSEKMNAQILFKEEYLDLCASISREQFERSVAEEVQQIEECLLKMMTWASLTPQKIDAVFLTGGTAQLPIIRTFFEKTFGAKKINTGSFFTSVVQGLALSAAMLLEA